MTGGAKLRPGRVFGRSVLRLEDPPLVLGRGQFVGDLGFPHQLHMRVVRSSYAHAVLRAVDIRGSARRTRRRHCVDRQGRRLAADRFPRSGRRGAAPVSPAAARSGPAALCRRAGRRGVRERPVPRRGRRRSCRDRCRGTAAAARRRGATRRLRARPVDRGAGVARRIRRRRRSFRVGGCGRSARSDDRPAQRRAARDARRLGPPRSGA